MTNGILKRVCINDTIDADYISQRGGSFLSADTRSRLFVFYKIIRMNVFPIYNDFEYKIG